jgi:hypothetical protein
MLELNCVIYFSKLTWSTSIFIIRISNSTISSHMNLNIFIRNILLFQSHINFKYFIRNIKLFKTMTGNNLFLNILCQSCHTLCHIALQRNEQMAHFMYRDTAGDLTGYSTLTKVSFIKPIRERYCH